MGIFVPVTKPVMNRASRSLDGSVERPVALGAPIVRMGTVTSTMDIARQLERLEAAEGIVVIAASQTQGRGRAGRSWRSATSAGLYCSILLRPQISPHRFQPFSIAVGLALCEALDPEQQIGLQLKWPNDIVYREKKLAGILLTTSLGGAVIESAILGIGLNLNPDTARPDHAISLTEIPGSNPAAVEQLFESIARMIGLRYDAILCQDPERALADADARLAFLGRTVTIEDGALTHSGQVIGIDERGALLIDTPSGLIAISSGELTRGPRS